MANMTGEITRRSIDRDRKFYSGSFSVGTLAVFGVFMRALLKLGSFFLGILGMFCWTRESGGTFRYATLVGAYTLILDLLLVAGLLIKHCGDFLFLLLQTM